MTMRGPNPQGSSSARSEITVPQIRSTNSGSGAGVGLIFAGVLVILLTFAGTTFSIVPAASAALLIGFGMILVLLGVIIVTFTRLYYRAPADRAFVRTGLGGPKPIIDGGALIVPVVHDVLWVSLQTMRLEVTRQAEDALITRDYLRADITAEFYIKVPKNPQAVLTASTSLGVGASDPNAVRDLLEKKLVSALRQVAAEMEITDLLVNRATFIESVSKHVKSDIANNGLELESVTISKLDQTRRTALRAEDNVFDAQGDRKIIEIVTAQRVQSTQLQLEADRKIAQQRVETDKFLYDQEVARAAAEAEKQRQISVAQATAKQEAATKAAEQDRLSKVAEVERDQAVQLAEVTRDQAVQLAAVTRDQAVQVANQKRDEATQVATVTKNQALEVANRQREIAVANKERERAAAQAEQLDAEALRAQNEQAVQTINVTAEAERRKAQAVITAQAETERRRLEEEMKAKVAAFAVTTSAQAEQDAAQRRAHALLTQAEANQKARTLEAQGEQALQMVPVEVERQRVDVEQARVTVLRNELASKAEFESIARQLQVELARIEAEKQARIAQAEAFGKAMGAANMTIWGDPATLNRMSEAFYRGQAAGQMIDGFSISAPGATTALTTLLTAFAQKLLGSSVDPKMVESFIKDNATDNHRNPA